MREHERAALLQTTALAERVADQLAATDGHEYCSRLARAHALALVDTLHELTAASSEADLASERASDAAGCFVDLNDAVAQACSLARTDVPITRDEGEVQPIVGERGEIVSAVLNLLLNAADATTRDGRITVRTGSTNESSWLEVDVRFPVPG